MNTECQSYDIISTLPQNIIENILSLMPIKDALRTSILSKKWRCSWRNMPKLKFTYNRMDNPFDCECGRFNKYKFVNTIFHVLLLHNGPTILELDCHVGQLEIVSEFDQILSYVARGNKVKDLTLKASPYCVYKLPVSFFSLQGLEVIFFRFCTFELPLTFNGFSRLKSIKFYCVEVSAQMLLRFLSKCPLLEFISLDEYQLGIDFVARGETKFTFVDLLRCVPLIQSLSISTYYMKYLSSGDMPHKLPTSPTHLKYLFLEVCLIEQNEVSSALCMIRSSPMLEKIKIWMQGDEDFPVTRTSTNFLELIDYSDLKLDHLKTLEIYYLTILPFATGFVKFIMANSPVLEKVQIMLCHGFPVNEELEMLRDLVLISFPRASPAARLIIKRP